MDMSYAVCLWVTNQRMRKPRQSEKKKFWVHPI